MRRNRDQQRAQKSLIDHQQQRKARSPARQMSLAGFAPRPDEQRENQD